MLVSLQPVGFCSRCSTTCRHDASGHLFGLSEAGPSMRIHKQYGDERGRLTRPHAFPLRSFEQSRIVCAKDKSGVRVTGCREKLRCICNFAEYLVPSSCFEAIAEIPLKSLQNAIFHLPDHGGTPTPERPRYNRSHWPLDTIVHCWIQSASCGGRYK